MKKYYRFLIIFLITLFLEVIVFNITSYRLLFGKYQEKTFDNLEALEYDEEDTKVYLKIENINQKVGTVKLELKNFEETTEYQILFSDETSNEFIELKSKTYVQDYEKSKYVPLYLSGETKKIEIAVDKTLYEEEKIDKVIINEKIPFEFSIIRFISIFMFLSFLDLFRKSNFLNETYSKKNFKQELFLLLILLIFMVILSCINSYSDEEKNIDEGLLSFLNTEGGIYNKDFVEAVKQKQFYLLKEPSKELSELENPYDCLSRDQSVRRDIDYDWDTAYFNGHEYIYFGILPLLLTFLPYNLIFHKYLKVSVVVFVFSIFIFILLKEILLKILQKYFDEIPFKNVVCYLIILCSGSIVLYANGMARVYELVIIVGLYFVLQGIYFILKSSETDKRKYINIFLGSLCLALSVACRPTDLLASLIIVPYFLKLLIQNLKDFKQNKKNLFKLIFAVGIPYIAVGISLMYYNYIRFGNVFDFGAKYQLTIANMYNLKSRIYVIPIGIITNLFSIPTFILDFPFITNNYNIPTFYGYYFVEAMLGGLFMIAPICFLVFLIKKANKVLENKEVKCIINSLVITGTLILIISVMMAGSNPRYLIDYAWMFVLAGILIFLVIYNALKTDEAKKILQHLLLIVTVYTFIISVLMGIVSEKSYFRDHSPEEYYKTKYTVCFWE